MKKVKYKKIIPQIIKDVKATKPQIINWNTDKIISFTQLTKFSNCSYSWMLEYRDKIKIPNFSINMLFGTSLHNVIQQYLDVYYNKSKAGADRLDMEMTFKNMMKSLYLEQYTKNNSKHFSTPEELSEFAQDGVEILRYFKRKVGNYFSKTGWHLIGCEVPISHNILPNVFYNGSLDIVLYHEPTNKIQIIDLKTSTRTWYDKQKKDETKLAQLLLYKKLFSEQYNFPIDNIEVKFIILKRKINTESDFVEKRFQEFIPASGKGKITKAYSLLENFANSTFTEHGELRMGEFKKNISPDSCRFCIFKDLPQHCSRNGVFKKAPDPFDIY